MHTEALAVDGAFVVTPVLHGDERGHVAETFRADVFEGATGHPFHLAQANTTFSARGVLRGVHFALVPPGQAKYVSCLAGAILDVVVDVRVGSPTFGRHVAVELDAARRRSIYLAEGLGHAFYVLSETATVHYLCSAPYAPGREVGIYPLDPELALPWPADVEPVLSAKDAAAPTLADARASGLLPDHAACRSYVASLGGAPAAGSSRARG